MCVLVSKKDRQRATATTTATKLEQNFLVWNWFASNRSSSDSNSIRQRLTLTYKRVQAHPARPSSARLKKQEAVAIHKKEEKKKRRSELRAQIEQIKQIGGLLTKILSARLKTADNKHGRVVCPYLGQCVRVNGLFDRLDGRTKAVPYDRLLILSRIWWTHTKKV